MFCGFVCSFVCLLLFQTMAAGESKQIQNHEQLQETVLSFKWPVLRSALRIPTKSHRFLSAKSRDNFRLMTSRGFSRVGSLMSHQE